MVPMRSEAHTRTFRCCRLCAWSMVRLCTHSLTHPTNHLLPYSLTPLLPCFPAGLLSHGLSVHITRVDRAWVEGLTAQQRVSADGHQDEWMQCTARSGRPFWHRPSTGESVWIDPSRSAAWRSVAVPFEPQATLMEGDILFVEATVVC